jgi:hypothetical protein
MTTVFEKKQPFPHLIIEDLYSAEELKLVWDELRFLTQPGKLMDAAFFDAAWTTDSNGERVYYTNSKALILDHIYSHRDMSNILMVNRKLFTNGYLKRFSELAPYLVSANKTNWDLTKVRYYGDGAKYDPHTDVRFVCLAVSFFHKTPKKFDGGELYFPDHDYQYECPDNSMIVFPGFIKHGVNLVRCGEGPFSGSSRYSMTQFLGSYANIAS